MGHFLIDSDLVSVNIFFSVQQLCELCRRKWRKTHPLRSVNLFASVFDVIFLACLARVCLSSTCFLSNGFNPHANYNKKVTWSATTLTSYFPPRKWRFSCKIWALYRYHYWWRTAKIDLCLGLCAGRDLYRVHLLWRVFHYRNCQCSDPNMACSRYCQTIPFSILSPDCGKFSCKIDGCPN